jgi:hypothetical protein
MLGTSVNVFVFYRLSLGNLWTKVVYSPLYLEGSDRRLF